MCTNTFTPPISHCYIWWNQGSQIDNDFSQGLETTSQGPNKEAGPLCLDKPNVLLKG